jgi:hypothetical protein
VLAMRPGLAKIIEKVHISWNFQSFETTMHVTANPCHIDATGTESSKWVHSVSKSQCTNRSTTYYGYKTPVQFEIGVTIATLPITRIHTRVPQESKIQW